LVEFIYKLTSKTRVLKAIAHKKPDRNPVDYCARDDFSTRFMKYLKVSSMEELYQRLDINMRRIPIKEHIPEFEQRINVVLGGTSASSGGSYIFHKDGSFEG